MQKKQKLFLHLQHFYNDFIYNFLHNERITFGRLINWWKEQWRQSCLKVINESVMKTMKNLLKALNSTTLNFDFLLYLIKMYTISLQSISVVNGQINIMVKISVAITFFPTAVKFFSSITTYIMVWFLFCQNQKDATRVLH